MSDLRAALERVRVSRGELTPEAVVDEWRPIEHPEHDNLTWDDRVAGERWRREEAHRLIKSVKVTYTSPEGRDESVRRYVAVPRPESRQPDYIPSEQVAIDDFSRQLVLNEMERRWRALRRDYEGMAEFMAMIARDLRGDTG